MASQELQHAYRQFYRFKELFDEKDKKGLLGLAALLKEDGRECFYWSIFIRTIANPFTPRLTKEQEKVLWEFADAYEAMNHEDLNDELMFGWKIIADSDGIKSICKNIRHYAEW